MSDVDDGNDNAGGQSYLWILFFSLFLLLLSLSVYALCRGWCVYCRGRAPCCCCCAMDAEAYRRERESLRRLRELRHIHRMEQFQLRQQQAAALRMSRQHHHGHIANHNNTNSVSPAAAVEFHPIPLATFSQIPGAIPHSFSSSGRVLTPAELQNRPTGLSPLAQAYYNMNALGFVLVPGNGVGLDTARRGVMPSNENALQFRDNLTAEQRRAILERLLVFTTYHGEAAENAAVTTERHEPAGEETATDTKDTPPIEAAGKDSADENDTDNAVLDHVEAGGDQDTNDAASSSSTQEEPVDFVFPLHEEPEAVEKTCAICLDEFEAGELINDASKCPHVFHRECLLSWLDRHNVCPCCRRTMVSENEWQSAAATGAEEEAATENNSRATVLQDGGGT